MNSGRILVNGSSFYCGNSTSSLCQLALKSDIPNVAQYVHPAEKQCNYAYTHPSTKQCNYSYTHPSSKQCNWSPGPENLWKLLNAYTVNLNWTRLQHDNASAIGQQFDISQFTSAYSQLKLRLKVASIGSLYYQSSWSSDYVYHVYYSLDSEDLDQYGQTNKYELSTEIRVSRNQTITNRTITATAEYSSLTSQLPWQRISQNSASSPYIKLSGYDGSYRSARYDYTDNARLSIYFGGTSSDGIQDSTGSNIKIEVELYGANF